MSDFWEGFGRAWGSVPGAVAQYVPFLPPRLRAEIAPPRAEAPMPSRGAVRDAVGGGAEDPRDRDKRLRENYARNQADRGARNEDPRNVRTQTQGGGVPTDDKRMKVGTGTVSETGEPTASAYGDYHVVRFPDGRVVVTPTPEGETATGGTRDPAGRRANVVAGTGGTAFTPSTRMRFPGPEADFSEVNLPGADRSPGWAARAALNEAFRAGELSMDPRSVMERRQFEEQETARDMARERAEVEHEASIRAAMMPPVDPYEIERIKAEARYGGRGLQEEMTTQRIMGALTLYSQITQRINALEEQMGGLDPNSAQYQALVQTRDRLIQERREMPNLALGMKLTDPRLDPLTAMLGVIGAGGPRTEEGR